MDGAMGTQIQAREVPADAWQGKDGCNELLNLTAPDVIRDIHLAYLKAGSDAVETNSFGASSITLGEYDLSSRDIEINKAAARVAREAADEISTDEWPRYVIGSIGPGTKLPTLGQLKFDELCDALQRQIEGLAEGGADAILLETCQDLLQIKAGAVAFDKVLGKHSDKLLYVSVTVEQTGTLLIGSNIGAVVAALSPFPIDILGLNCATGPEAMRIHLDYLAENWPRLLACMPNAGLPVLTPEGAHYPLEPKEFSELLGTIAREVGLNVIGGCCGTRPEHITALRKVTRNFVAPQRARSAPEQVASIFTPVDLTQEPPPLYVGERANATGSKKFRETLLADDYDSAFSILTDQEEVGAHLLDISCAYAGRDEIKDMSTIIAQAAQECRLPLMIDSTQPKVMETALKLHGGRCILNSINFESGEEKAAEILELARQFGAAVVALTIDETGMAMTIDRKVEIAKRLVKFCETHGLRRGDIFIDALTFTIGSGDDTLRDAAKITLEAIRRIKTDIPGVRTILGLSNISFGLKPAGRKVLNALFLDECIKAGMDSCIINVAAIAPLNQIPDDTLKVARALLFNDSSKGDPLENFINFFEDKTAIDTTEEEKDKPPEEALTNAVIKGKTQILSDVMPLLLKSYAAEEILNDLLVPAMKEVGRLFNEGILQLPFVLKSAEVMKKSVDLIKPYMKKEDAAGGRGTMVIATVTGDVHDIGKNLVDIILSNNGFKVINLGTKVPIEQMMKAVKEHNADVLGMSGLLVKSAAIMAESMKALAASDIRVPIFLGGAALTPRFVSDACQPEYASPVVYCRDAFDGLARMREYRETGEIKLTPPRTGKTAEVVKKDEPRVEIDLSEPPPKAPFIGYRTAQDISLEEVYPYLNERTLIRGRWGYRRNKLSDAEYEKILREEVEPKLTRMKKECMETGLLKPRAAYGYFKCHGHKEKLYIEPAEGGKTICMEFPRQSKAPFFSIPDFFQRDEDLVGFMVVTLGPGLESENMKLLEKDQYQDYFLLHGFAVEVTDALAEYWHARIRAELGFPDPPGLSVQDYIKQNYRGSRYGFGYPACPDLSGNKVCCDLVHADEIGVQVTENFMMSPEVTTCGLVAHHPQAKYFFT